jgi:hypothetical protein
MECQSDAAHSKREEAVELILAVEVSTEGARPIAEHGREISDGHPPLTDFRPATAAGR